MNYQKKKITMSKIIILLIAAMLPIFLAAQPAEVAAKRIRATEKLQLSNKTLTAIVESITVLSTHAQSPTAKAVYDLTAAMITSVSTNATLSGNGTSGDPLKIAQQSATSGQVLKWNGSTWLPAADNNASYTGGTGIDITGTVITNTSPNINQTISTTGAAGNITLSNSGGTLNLNVNDADASPTNEIQTLSYSAPNLSLSLGGGTVAMPQGTVTGTGVSGKVAYWSGSSAITSTTNFPFDGTNLAVGRSTAGAGRFNVTGNSTSVCAQFDAGTLPSFGSQIQSTGTTASGNSILGLDLTGTTTGSTTNYLHKLENNGTGSTILQLNSASAGGSPFVQYNIVGGSSNWTHGVDNADSRKFKIRPNADWSGTTGLTITTGGLVGVANSSPAASLDMDNTTDGIAISSGNTANRPTSGLRWVRYNSNMAGLETRTISSNWHVLNSANSVTLGAGGALGTAPTITVNNGTEMAYTVSLTVGTAPVANAVIFTRTFPSTWSVAPTVVFSPSNIITASEITKIYVDTQTTGQYTIRANGTLTAGQTYKLNVIVRN